MADQRAWESGREDAIDTFLGRGWSFPIRWDLRGRRSAVRMVERIEDIRESIRLILETALGERVMHPDFGSQVHRFVFASTDVQTRTDLAHTVRNALVLWERRIRDLEVDVVLDREDPHRLDVEVSFSVDTHRMRHSLIFPFYVDQPEGY